VLNSSRSSRVILGPGGVSIAMVIDLVVYVICPPLLRQPRRTSSLSGTSRFRKGHVTGASFSRFGRSEPQFMGGDPGAGQLFVVGIADVEPGQQSHPERSA
jgi:hypothetical protein